MKKGYGILARLLVLSAFLAIYVYVSLLTQDIIESMQSYKDTLQGTQNAKQRAVIENEIKYYWIINGVSLVLAALTSLNIVLVLVEAAMSESGLGTGKSEESTKKKKKNVKSARP